MPLSVILATLLALVTPSPSPMPMLSFSDGLRRLIADAPNFVNDRGAKVIGSDGQTDYVLKFTIEGFTGCRIVPSAFAACGAYTGKDEAKARSTYDTVKAQLRAFAGRNVPIHETTMPSSDGAWNPIPDTRATFHPNDRIFVSIVKAQLKTKWLVVLYVALAPPSQPTWR